MTRKAKFKERKNLLLNLDWFDANFWSLQTNCTKLLLSFNEKKWKLNTDNLSSRVITHWQNEGIINDNRQASKGWRKFSFSERIWIACIIQMRKFGLDLEKIKKVKSELETYKTDESISDFPLLDFYIINAKITNEPVKLIVFCDGESLIARQIDIDIAKSCGLITDDYISIDLNVIANRFINNNQIKTDYLNYSKTEIEKEVYKSIYFEDVRSLKLTTNNGEEFLLDKEFILSSKKEMEVLLNKLQYADASISKKKNYKVHKVKEKKKIKK